MRLVLHSDPALVRAFETPFIRLAKKMADERRWSLDYQAECDRRMREYFARAGNPTPPSEVFAK